MPRHSGVGVAKRWNGVMRGRRRDRKRRGKGVSIRFELYFRKGIRMCLKGKSKLLRIIIIAFGCSKEFHILLLSKANLI